MTCNRHILRAAATALLGLVIGYGCSSSTPDRTVSTTHDQAPSGRQYELRIESIPLGSAVTIDGKSAGNAPVTRRFDGPATVVVEVTAPGYAPAKLRTDGPWWLRSAAAKAARRFAKPVVVRTFRAKLGVKIALRVVSEPSGGLVTINGKPRGVTPARLDWDGVTPLVLRVARDGFMSFTATLDAAWWHQNQSSAELDADGNGFVAIVSARLSPTATGGWTRVGQSTNHVSLAIQPGASHQTVPATIRGPRGQREVKFLFDTGATFTTLDTKTAEAIGLDFSQATVRIIAQTANGIVTRNVLLLPELDIGGYGVRNVAVIQCDNCRSDELVGLLGLNVTREFSTNISAEGQQLTLTPSKSGLGRVLSIKAFLAVSELTPTSALFVNQCDQTMRKVVVELIQRDAAGQRSKRVRTPRFTLPGGGSRRVNIDLTRLTEGQSYELRVVEGKW